MRLSRKQGSVLAEMLHNVERLPRAVHWNARRTAGYVTVRSGESYHIHEEYLRLVTAGFITEATHPEAQPDCFLMTVTETGRAALAVWLTDFPHAADEEYYG